MSGTPEKVSRKKTVVIFAWNVLLDIILLFIKHYVLIYSSILVALDSIHCFIIKLKFSFFENHGKLWCSA